MASVGHSEPAAPAGVPQTCRGRQSESLATLEKRKRQLEREIAQARAQRDTRSRGLSRSQADLLEVLFQIECAKAQQRSAAAERRKATAKQSRRAAPRSASPRAPGSGRGRTSPATGQGGARLDSTSGMGGLDSGAAPLSEALGSSPPARALRASEASGKTGNAVAVTTYFATNRGRTGASEPAKAYDANVSPLSYGRAVVSIPSTHEPGNIELPSIWRLEFRADPERHFILKEAAVLTRDAAYAEVVKALARAESKSLLVFVHGYNMSFEETAMRTAQLAYDLNFRGVPFFFSWPSAGEITGYLRDAETAQLSEAAFDKALDDLSRLPVKDVYLIAHSMGSRLVSQVLKSRVDRGKPTPHLSELLLAAPDINADLFRKVIAPRLARMQGMQTTLYASSSDLALKASKAVHGYARVGETADGVFVFPGLETIDASMASMAARAFGHSYLTDSAAVLRDIRTIVRKKLSAKERGLTQAGAAPNVYWSLR